MLPFLIGGGVLGLLHLLNKREEKAKVPAFRAGYQPATPSPELLAVYEELLVSEESPEKLRAAAVAFMNGGYPREAGVLERKAQAKSAVKPVNFQVSTPSEAGPVITEASALDMAKALLEGSKEKGAWYWNVELLRSFQAKMDLNPSGLFDQKTLETMRRVLPESAGLWLNSGLFSFRADGSTTAENPPEPEISMQDLKPLGVQS